MMSFRASCPTPKKPASDLWLYVTVGFIGAFAVAAVVGMVWVVVYTLVQAL